MADEEIKPSALVQMYIDERDRGKTWTQIAEKFDKDPDEVYRAWNEYMSTNRVVNEAEYRMLQLSRLERMIDALWELAIKQNSLDHIKALLPVLQEISKLLGLHKDKTTVEVRVIEEKQLNLVVAYLDAVTETVKGNVMKTITAKTTRQKIEEQWDKWVANAAESPLKEIESATVEL